jgi:hypothetical protein
MDYLFSNMTRGILGWLWVWVGVGWKERWSDGGAVEGDGVQRWLLLWLRRVELLAVVAVRVCCPHRWCCAHRLPARIELVLAFCVSMSRCPCHLVPDCGS